MVTKQKKKKTSKIEVRIFKGSGKTLDTVAHASEDKQEIIDFINKNA